MNVSGWVYWVMWGFIAYRLVDFGAQLAMFAFTDKRTFELTGFNFFLSLAWTIGLILAFTKVLL